MNATSNADLGGALTPMERHQLAGQTGGVVWFTGLSGSGKTTLSNLLERSLFRQKKRTFPLDGDAIRNGLNANLGFTPEDREENLRRFTEVARLFADAGLLALVSVISPYEAAREAARRRIGRERFVLVHVATSLEVCEQRDVKGLYARARAGQLPQFTGIDAPYEIPLEPDVRVGPDDGGPRQSVEKIMTVLKLRGLLSQLAAEETGPAL